MSRSLKAPLTPLEIARLSLLEDAAQNDLTSLALRATLPKAPEVVAFELIAKSSGVFAGQSWLMAMQAAARELFREASLNIEATLSEGASFSPKSVLVRGRANALTLLSVERTLLNGLQHLCGVATETRLTVERVQKAWLLHGRPGETAPQVFHTRKTLPLLRALQIEAVLAGGGAVHRSDLESRILFKENHKYLLQAAGLSLADFCAQAQRRGELATALIEVESEQEALELVEAGARNILCDNFRPADLAKLLPKLPPECVVEVSGSLTLTNIADYVLPGVQRLSLGSLTHSVKAADISLDFTL